MGAALDLPDLLRLSFLWGRPTCMPTLLPCSYPPYATVHPAAAMLCTPFPCTLRSVSYDLVWLCEGCKPSSDSSPKQRWSTWRLSLPSTGHGCSWCVCACALHQRHNSGRRVGFGLVRACSSGRCIMKWQQPGDANGQHRNTAGARRAACSRDMAQKEHGRTKGGGRRRLIKHKTMSQGAYLAARLQTAPHWAAGKAWRLRQ